MKRLEIASQNNNSNNNNTSEGNLSKIDLKKFPQYKKGYCPESFLISFERACWDFDIKDDERMIVLRSQISGDLAEQYSQMPLEQARDFEAYRKMVYSRFGINAEHLRRKFRALTKRPEESYSQIVAKLLQCLDKWMEHENVTSLEQVKNVIGLKQFYSILPGELHYLVRDKNPKTLLEAGEQADYINEFRNPRFFEVKFN